MPSEKAIMALTMFADSLRSRGHDDVADEIEAIAEDYAKQKAPQKKKP